MKKNLRRFSHKIFDDLQGLPLMLQLFFQEILDDFRDFVSECVFPENHALVVDAKPRKINNPFWSVTVFPRKSVQFSLDVQQKHTFYRRIFTNNR